MKIKEMFVKDIDRDINGVVKVAQEDDASIRQELEEYVVTRELRRRFGDFFNAYERALDVPTDKIGVWVSGFFGSGKSHFLKMLSYLLSGKQVDGRAAIDYFTDPATGESKFGDEMLASQARRCCSVPTESILFNIDNKGFTDKDKTAILKVFARVFYEHLGFYGEDLKLARLEKYIDDQGKTSEFRTAFERVNGGAWVDERPTYDFNSDDVIEALAASGVMSEAEAERWFEGSEDLEFSSDKLTDEISSYARRRAEESGGTFRLIFCVDEVGQYIGSDGNLMLNLQTIVEDLGAKCSGLVWVVVTSQEAIDEVTKISGYDFSKIQARFNTRLSLSSSSVDEVIKRRVLDKTPVAADMLALGYERDAAVLKNLFTFEECRSDLTGYAGSEDFAQSYPFVSYQFKLAQDVFTEIRKHGSSGKHLSSGERSMLSGFQEAAQRIKEGDERSLVPFSLFYDTVSTFLEGVIRRVIDRCQDAADNAQGIEQQDVEVLKLLFLVRHIKDVRANVNNIAILLTDSIDADKVALRERVVESLDRLVRQNYIARTGDVYQFLTDEQQDIARAIRETPVDTPQITARIGSVLFDDVFTDKKLRVGVNDFPIDRFIDETPYGVSQGGLKLRVITALSDVSGEDHQSLTLRSAQGEAICVLAGDEYYEAIEEAARIQRYAATQNLAALPASTRGIVEDRVRQQHELEREAKGLLEKAITGAAFYVAGSAFTPKVSGARQRLAAALTELVDSVYTKLSYVNHNVADDAEVLAIAQGRAQAFEGMEPNARAISELEGYLEAQRLRNLSTSMAEVQSRFSAAPYGWREIDVAAVLAALVAKRGAQIRYQGTVVPPDSRAFADMLRQRSKIASVSVERRVSVSPEQCRRAREILQEALGATGIPADEDGLCRRGGELLMERRDELERLLETEYKRGGYPGRIEVEHGERLMQELLTKIGDATVFVQAVRDSEDELLDFAEDYSDIRQFFKAGQREQFDRARNLMALMTASEREFLADDERVVAALDTIAGILSMKAPYGRIKDLPEAVGAVESAHGDLLAARRNRALDMIKGVSADIEGYAKEHDLAATSATSKLDALKNVVHSAKTLTELAAVQPKLEALREQAYRDLDRKREERDRPKPATTDVTVTRDTKGKTDQTGQQPKPVRRPKGVSISMLARPTTICSADDVDAYLAELRQRLLSELDASDGDGIRVR